MRTLEVMSHIDRASYQFHFCALSGKRGVLDNKILELGGHVHLIPLGRGFASRFMQLVREHQFDVVHSHVHYFSGYILRLAAKSSVPGRIAHFRISDDGRRGSLSRYLQDSLMRCWIHLYATDILAVSNSTMAIAWRARWRRDPRCKVIYNGLEISRFLGDSESDEVRKEFGIDINSHVIVHVGRFDQQKNHGRLISIFSEICKTETSCYLIMVGQEQEPVASIVHAQIAQFGIVERAIFAGDRNDVPRLLKAADLMLFPSLREGLPGVVLEGAAAGIPVLASNIPGVIEIADVLPNVHVLSLSSPDRTWAMESLRLFYATSDESTKAQSVEAFRASPFSIDRCVEALVRVWQGYQR